MGKYVLSIDQSTQGTKALLLDSIGSLLCRTDLPHKQIVDENGWVEHDPIEIYQNTIQVVKNLIIKANLKPSEMAVLGISNQRETAVVWDRETGEPIYNAIVWQCARGAKICEEIAKKEEAEDVVRNHTGLQLSPYFSAAKIAWVLQNVDGAMEKARKGELCCGTVDSWLVYKLTGGTVFKTDYSNASRTQMFNIHTLQWDKDVCDYFGIPTECLAEITDSDGDYGETDFEGLLETKIPIRGVLGDSHGALFGQGCLEKGMIKTTYGTGSSIMMNIGETPIHSKNVVCSLAWGRAGKVNYVLEGNINYSAAVVSWLKDDLELIDNPIETEELAKKANPKDTTYIVPAFSGLGAPYWDSNAKASVYGMTRTTKKAEFVKAALESIAYQIADIVKDMETDSGIEIKELRVDGGATRNRYLMQFQSDILGIPVKSPTAEELSGIGAGYMAGSSLGIYDMERIFSSVERFSYTPKMESESRTYRYKGWKEAVSKTLTNN